MTRYYFLVEETSLLKAFPRTIRQAVGELNLGLKWASHTSLLTPHLGLLITELLTKITSRGEWVKDSIQPRPGEGPVREVSGSVKV